MKYSLKDIRECNISTDDGSLAKINDILFDDDTWIVRYVEIDFGGLYKGSRVLVPRVLLKNIDLENKIFTAAITETNIEMCPKIDEDQPISRQFEEELSEFYGLDVYWAYNYPFTSTGLGNDNITPPRTTEDSKQLNLHSLNEVEGFPVNAGDGTVGYIDDMVIDNLNWEIWYFAVTTVISSQILKKVLLCVDYIEEVNFEKEEVRTKLFSDTIKKAPDYESASQIDENYERYLNEFYEKVAVR